MNGLNCFGIDVRNASTNRLTIVDSQIVVASGITTSKPAIKSFLRSCWSLALSGRSGLGLDWTKKPLCPQSESWNQPNQRSAQPSFLSEGFREQRSTPEARRRWPAPRLSRFHRSNADSPIWTAGFPGFCVGLRTGQSGYQQNFPRP